MTNKPTEPTESKAQAPAQLPGVHAAEASASVPLSIRLAHEIPKPRDWQAFQRNCVLLFRAEWNDPLAQEYGRSGQKQRGIDILGQRELSGALRHVGVQCRLISTPLTKKQIERECLEAIALVADLREIIFATTAPDDTHATDAAIEVQNELLAKGHILRVVVYGWGNLQTLIASHNPAYNAFFPQAVATATAQTSSFIGEGSQAELASQIAALVAQGLRSSNSPYIPKDVIGGGTENEDAALHAKIDTYRDLFKRDNEYLVAERGLRGLLTTEQLDGKPWARFRIETNLASIEFELGREDDAANRFEAAHALRPNDPSAVANLGLARLIQGRFDEAIDLTQSALHRDKPPEHAVAVLLQAAARSSWQGDPESLIPEALKGSPNADLGVAEFLRRRETAGWEKRTRELARRHPEQDEFARLDALAVLSLAIRSGMMVGGVHGPVRMEDVNRSADVMKAFATRRLDCGFADKSDLVAQVSNTALALRLADRDAEAEPLLLRAIEAVPSEPSLRRQLALIQVGADRVDDALATLSVNKAADDVESVLLACELLSLSDPAEALKRLLSMADADLSGNLSKARWGLIAELSLKLDDRENLQKALSALRELDPKSVTITTLQIRVAMRDGATENETKTRFGALVRDVHSSIDSVNRFLLAFELSRHNLPEETCALLDGHVDLSRPTPLAILYLQSLADARRDETFRRQLENAGDTLRNDPRVLWICAVQAWNAQDLDGARRYVDLLLHVRPDSAQARLLRIEVALRQSRSTDALSELEKPLEKLGGLRPHERFRVVALLRHFGYLDRAAALAYRLFLENRDNPQAWLTLSTLVIFEGRVGSKNEAAWERTEVGPDTAVDVEYSQDERSFLVLEPDATLRKYDAEAWELEHAFVQALMGLRVGDTFVDPLQREGVVLHIRHKYVARAQYVLEHYQSRFPESFDLLKVTVAPDKEGGLNGLIEQLKAKRDWTRQETEQYSRGTWPIELLALRLGIDAFDVAAGVAAQGTKLKVATGENRERERASHGLDANQRRGCVLDYLAFWTAWKLQALDAVIAVCGPILLPQSVIDRLNARFERLKASPEGIRTLGYGADAIAMTETSSDVVRKWEAEVAQMIEWARANTTICPVIAPEALPSILREVLQHHHSAVFDAVIVAVERKLLLVSDDYTTRAIRIETDGGSATWLHQVLASAVEHSAIDLEFFVECTVMLIRSGQNYLSVSAAGILAALRKDIDLHGSPGQNFRAMIEMIGGQNADPFSHVKVSVECLAVIWTDSAFSEIRGITTGLLLDHLLRRRHNDYMAILRVLLLLGRAIGGLREYVRTWARGHLIMESI